MSVSTKQRILSASIRLFNEYGVDAVRLQQIAEEIGISVGNLAYHFKTKDAIVESVYEQVLDEFAHIFRQYLQSPQLSAFDQQLSLYYQFFRQNQFYLAEFFKQSLEQTPSQQVWQRAVNKMLIQLRSWLDFQIKRGVLRAEENSGQYDQLAETLWTSLIFLPVSNTMRGRLCNETVYKQTIWNYLKPYLTTEGVAEFDDVVAPLINY
ncbi:TetR/AcrR family transcriptional regulator [Spirosoma montaniterrae]|uniref:TetR family transcriptional regulator n=1 Tax=Spirosoma montaniterrae TaxID=1178516 RepID=A0A1P9WU72_9BACT|nr:TetR/AcrR family transcriptional regulator [Spirosoma montaniterrae]AQG78932.1 TetR family transcriptional regulator [Spirosoma montaniterrae]